MNTTPSSTLHLTSATTAGGIAELICTPGISGLLWSPEPAADGAPLLLTGHGGGASGLVSRARRAVAGDGPGDGFTVAAVDAPGHGGRPRSGRQAGAIRRAAAAG